MEQRRMESIKTVTCSQVRLPYLSHIIYNRLPFPKMSFAADNPLYLSASEIFPSREWVGGFGAPSGGGGIYRSCTLDGIWINSFINSCSCRCVLALRVCK